MAQTSGYAQISRGLKKYSRLWHDTTGAVLTRESGVILDRIRTEHRWKNRTGTAERSLFCGVIDQGDIEGFRVVAGYGPSAPYSVYLEFAMQHRWAVLEPVMRSQWPKTAAKVARAIRSASGGAG